MTDLQGHEPLIETPVSRGMLDAWRLALTRPNEAAYQGLAEDPRGGVGRAAAWTAVAALATTLIGLAGQGMYGGLARALSILQESAPTGDLTVISSASMAMVICSAPFAAAFSVLGLLLFAGALQFIAGALGGQGTFGKMAFVLAAISAPLSIASALLSLIPLVGACLALPLGVYGLALNLLAIKAVNRFGWGRSVTTLGVLLSLVALITLVVVLLSMQAHPTDFLRDWMGA